MAKALTAEELSELLRDCPVLYHMAEAGSWPSIERHGLLSTSALLDLFHVEGERRSAVEARRRPGKVVLSHFQAGTAVVRDQKPMDDASLRRCLRDGLEPQGWYRLLNGKVFFWLTRTRLLRLLTARPYRADLHDVLELDAAALVRAYAPHITLSAINSGFTRRHAVARGHGTFQSIAAYPYAAWREKRPRGERVVELAVTGGIPDVARFIRRVSPLRGADLLPTPPG